MTVRIGRPLATRLVALGVVALLAAGVLVWAYTGAGRYYAFQPGSAPLITTSSSCRLDAAEGQLVLPGGAPCIRLELPPGRVHPVQGRLLMVDVLVGPATPWEYALRQLGLLDAVYQGSQLVPNQAVLGGAPPSQLGCQDAEQMAGATEAAPVAALARLGYKVTAVEHGGQLDEVLAGSAAARAGLHCGDRIVAVGGTPTATAAQVVRALLTHRPGQVVAVTVERSSPGGRTERITLHPRLTGTPALGGQPARPQVPFLGVEVQDSVTYRLPFEVGVDVGDIGGPSAGLAITLGILDALSGGHLTGGHTVAATGTISPDGAVGDVGGVAQKAVAISRAGATLFLVPVQELATARRHVGPHVRVEAVTSLEQALADLRAIGGQVPAPPGSVQH